MTQKRTDEIIAYIENCISTLPNEIGNKVYDAVTIEDGIEECIKYGRRLAYENILKRLKESKGYKEKTKRVKITNGQMMEQTFPGAEIKYIGFSAVVITTDDSGMEQEFSRKWWDAPYKRGEV